MPQTEVLLLSSRLTWHAGLIHPEKMRKIPFPYLHRVCVWKGEPNFFQVGLGYKTTVYCVCHVRMAIPAFNKNPFSTVKHCWAVFFPSSCFYVKSRKNQKKRCHTYIPPFWGQTIQSNFTPNGTKYDGISWEPWQGGLYIHPRVQKYDHPAHKTALNGYFTFHEYIIG